jgi:hypothetical protein
MTEADWWSCQDPDRMLDLLRRKARSWLTRLFARKAALSRKVLSRKLRLFGAACCRLNWPLLTHALSRRAVEVVEGYADGSASRDDLSEALRAAWKAYYIAETACLNEEATQGQVSKAATARWLAAELLCWFERDTNWRGLRSYSPALASQDMVHLASYARLPGETLRGGEDPGDKAVQADLLRDLFGSPFRAAPTLERALLDKHGGLVLRLAQGAYDERRLPAGTLDPARLAVLADALEEAGAPEEVHAHLRAPEHHVRGCWAVDLLLGKS